jgi:hypothetical protein
VSDHQQNQSIAEHLPGGLSVYVSHWPQTPTRAPKLSQVMWRDGNIFRYLPPQAARRFAAALVKAADEIDPPP